MEDTRSFPVSIETRAMHADLPEETDDKFWVRITASNGKRDKHNSIMDPETTLKNFEKDAKAKLGIALTDRHAWRTFGYGRSKNARLTEKNELLIDAFIVKGMDYSDTGLYFKSGEQLMRAIEQELVNQVSVEFYNARELCNLCNLPIRRYSYWDWEPEREGQCTHKMGKKYENKNGKMETATYTVYDAHLKNISFVEFGSNRHTSIEAQRFGEFPVSYDEVAGALRYLFTQAPEGHPFLGEMRSFMEELLMTDQEWIDQLREKLELPDLPTDDPEKAMAAVEAEVSKLREADAERNKQHVLSLREALGLKDVRSTDALDTVIEKAKTEIGSIRTTVEEQRDEIADLQADAEDGKAYRQARIDEAIKQGIRSEGDDFDEEYHREYYGDMPLEKLETHIAKNKERADKALPAGRSTTDTHEPPPENEKRTWRQRQRRRLGRR